MSGEESMTEPIVQVQLGEAWNWVSLTAFIPVEEIMSQHVSPIVGKAHHSSNNGLIHMHSIIIMSFSAPLPQSVQAAKTRYHRLVMYK
jgi:hypothetical protein